MEINKINNINFTSSRLNILSMADNHGDVLGIPQVIKTIQVNKDDIFEKSDEKSTTNIMAIGGDYFMNPNKKGLLTNPKLTIGDIQHKFLLKLIYEVAKTTNKNNYSTLYCLGNHCFGGGDKWLFDKLNKAPMTTLITNVDIKKSPTVQNVMSKSDKFVTQKVYEMTDDKNPDIKSHALFLGVAIPSTYYNKDTLNGIQFIDQNDKNDASIKEQDLKNTFNVLKENIKKYKKQYPDGIVILMAHMGNGISKMIAQNVKDIDVILNAHDHKNYVLNTGKTIIMSHGQNNDFVRGINIVFDDEGKLSYIKNEKFDTKPYARIVREDENIQNFVHEVLEKDLEPLVYYTPESGKSEEMVLDNTIRYQNSILANYITSGIMSAVKDKYPQVDCVGIPSTIFRNGLKSDLRRSTFNNVDLIDMFKGVDESVASLEIGAITGKELTELIVENVRNNLISKTRNALIQWSDFQINKTMLEKMFKQSNKNPDYTMAIKIRNSQTGEFENIKTDKKYTILLSDKYLVKQTQNITVPIKIRKNFMEIPETYDIFFKNYLDKIDRKVILDDKAREKRII